MTKPIPVYTIIIGRDLKVIKEFSGDSSTIPSPPKELVYSRYQGTLEELHNRAENLEHFGGMKPSPTFDAEAKAIRKWIE